MSIQMATRAKAFLDGELVEKPAFLMSRQTKYADIQLKTVESVIVGKERRRNEFVHYVRVINPRCLELLENFGQPGRHFHVEGKISYRASDGKMLVTVGIDSGELVLNYMGDDANPVKSSQPDRRQSDDPQSGARPAGGVGKLVGQSRPRDGQSDDQRDQQGTARGRRDDSDLDDRIPF
jgi:hypothetical protein